MNVFGENIGNTVREAFSYADGTSKWRSHSFNTWYTSSYHNQDKEMAEITKKCIDKILEKWKTCEGCLPTCRNYKVKDLIQQTIRTVFLSSEDEINNKLNPILTLLFFYL